MSRVNIAIDGPSGAGKSTLAKMMAEELGFIYVDTGAMYRAIGLHVLRNGIDVSHKEDIERCLDDICIDIRYIDNAQRVILNGEDVSGLIRTEEVSKYASDVSALPAVRKFLLSLQRNLAEKNSVIMDGRDIGTVILPHAEIKIFLTACDFDRARRRYSELLEKGHDVTFEGVLESIRQRDKNDCERELAPLHPAKDAVIVDTTGLTLSQATEILRKVIREKMPNV
ncbi:MAG: (d)CMP kinase [Clostridiaceae bacterium]|nr:(d)CMP kinase [Clostridiaceae bacterium]